MVIDFHAHVLPGIDDGAQDIATSLAILDTELHDGVDMIIATPHYYPEEQSVEDFLAARDKSYTKLIHAAEDKAIPSIKLGAEVYYSPILCNLPNLHDLCIDGTDYLLLELPYQELSPKLIDGISKLIYSSNVIPIIAHAERYLNYTSLESLEEILEMDVLAQVNASSLASMSTRKTAIKLIKNNYIHLIGTDVHNLTSRPPQMKEAEKVLTKKVSKNVFNYFMRNAKMVLANRDIDEIY